MADAAKKLVRLPRDLADLIAKEAKTQGISENTYLVAVIAASVGYKLPKR